MLRRLFLIACVAAPAVLSAQAADTLTVRVLEGHVERPIPGGLRPVPNALVVLHRVAPPPDSSGPLDSMRTDAQGRFRFRYRHRGSGDAVYFASVNHGGIAYFSAAANAESRASPDADITIFDTTSGPVKVRVAGHHLIVGAPRADRRREVEEVFELGNDSSVTLVARNDSTPVWTTIVPDDATDIRGAQTTDISPAAVSVRGSRVDLFAPLSPGMRQFAYTYQLPASAFPLTAPLTQGADVLEVLLEEPTATVSGANLQEVAPVSAQGRTFRRFLAQNVPPNATIRVVTPEPVKHTGERYRVWLAVIVAVLMLGALSLAIVRRTPRAVRMTVREATPTQTSASESLLRELAALDATFERSAATEAPTADARTRYDEARAALKARVAAALAEERGRR